MARKSTSLGSPLAIFALLGAGLLIALSPKKPPPVKPSSPTTGKSLTAGEQGEIASVLQTLGVDASGALKKRPALSAIARARSLAKTLAAAGFPEAAATLNQYAALAEKAPA